MEDVGGAPPVLTTIEVLPESASLSIGETEQFTATGYDQYGSVMTGITFTWDSSDEAVGTVGSNGLFTAIASGSATVTAESGGVEGTASVIVDYVPVLTTIEVLPESASLSVGETEQFTATGYDQYGSVMTGITFTWDSSDEAVGTVGSNGLFTAIGSGSTTVSATNGAVSDDASVSVAGGSSTTTYDFATGAGTDKWAYGYEVNYYVECSDTNPGDEITSSEYNQIASDDNSYFDSQDPGFNDRAAIRYEVDISENVADITDVSVTWKGYRGGSYEYDIGLYIWNHNLGIYELLELGTGTSEFTLTGSKTTDIGNYIDGDGDLVFLTYYFDTSERFYTDYVEVEVSYIG
ncbi:MAG: Ig-like domain-containing protein [Halobacteriota archaeon]|nr:Ig-like domain-containing protein [Halobacteriota archaeon]